MDNTTLAIFIHELRNQCLFTEASFRVFNQSLEQNIPTGVFFSAQGILLTASQISGILWPSRARAKARGKHIRDALVLADQHPLNDKRLITMFEHSDEKLEDWIGATKGEQIIFDHVGSLAEMDELKFSDENIFRLYDTATSTFYFRGAGFNMKALANAIADIYTRVTALHKSMFPGQYEDLSQSGNASEPANDDIEEKAEEAKPPAKKKPVAKKKAAPKKPVTPRKKAPPKKK
jgi:hypothetical protein